MISRDPSEALQVLVHVFEGLGRYTDPGLPGKSGSRGFKVVEYYSPGTKMRIFLLA